MPPVDTNPFEQAFQLISPYLPYSLASPLHSLLTLPSKLYSDPSQLLPLLLSLLALYVAVQSLYSSARMAFRAAWFLTKWGAIVAALSAGWASYNGYNVAGEGGGLEKMGNMGKTAFGLGKTGVDWWTQSGAYGGKTNARKTNTNGRSASGKKRTWAKPTNDGGWDDPEEIDLGGAASDPLKFVQDAVLTFLGSSSPSSSSSGSGAKGKAKQEEPSWLNKFALNQARQAWNGVSEQVNEALGGGGAGKKRGNR